VSTDVKTAELLLNTKYKTFQHQHTGRVVVKAHGAISVPASAHEHIDFIAGATELFTGRPKAYSYGPFANKKVSPQKHTRQYNRDIDVTPDLLRQFYNVPPTLVGTNKKNLQGIAAFNDFYSEGALKEFMIKYKLPGINITVTGTDCLPFCDEGESDLDMQYMMAMGRNVNIHFVQQTNDYWILQFAEQATNRLNPIPLVFSISYGFSELSQCLVATTNCQKLGYTPQQYVQRTNTELQKLGVAGVTVLVAAGEDGAANLGAATGNCPIDPNFYCPKGGCQHTSTKCPGVILTSPSGDKCIIPMGIKSTACQSILKNKDAWNNALDSFAQTNQRCSWGMESDEEGQPHVYCECQCSQLQKSHYRGYTVEPYTYNATNGALFVADYPASSPYITSVGATQWLSHDGVNVTKEVTASIKTGAWITTGGGFSSFQAQPSYQTNAVNAWLKRAKAENTLPPAGSFDTKYRAYPDISFNGHSYLVFGSETQDDDCPCEEQPADGSKASAPALAGLFTLMNDALLNAGKTQLGFVNPLLYQMAVEQPSAFKDITSGDNKCTRGWCCQHGYTATTGYDPATGLGTPNFSEMLKYIKRKKGVN